MLRDRRPAFVVDAAIPEHLEILRLVLLRRLGVIEGVQHADAFDRVLLDAVHRGRLREAGRLQDRGSHVDDVVELQADLALALDPLRPVDNGPVARAAPVRGDLFGPLVGRVHGVRPAHGVVVVGLGPAEFVEPRREILRRFERLQAVEVAHLVVAAVEAALGRGPVVADDVVHERVVEDIELLQSVQNPAHVVVGVLHVARVNFHLPAQHRLERLRHLVPGRDFLVTRGQLAVRRDDAELLLSCECLLAQLVPALVELALVLVDPFLRDVVGRVCRAGCEVDEEGLVGGEGFLLGDPGHRLVGHVLYEVVTLFGRFLGLDGNRAFIERRIPLVRLAADEAVEILEAAAARGPGVERTGGARLPDRHFVALAELRGGVTVQFERLRQRRHGIGPDRAVTGRARRDLGDAAHAGRMVIASGQQRLPRRRAERGGVEADVLQATRCQRLRARRLAGPAEGARRSESCVVDEHDQDVRCPLGRAQLLDGRKLAVRVLRVIGNRLGPQGVRHREMGTVLHRRVCPQL